MNKKTWITAAVIAAVAIGAYFLFQGRVTTPEQTTETLPTEQETAALPSVASIFVQDHEVVGDQIVIEKVDFTNPGYIVIHLSEDSKPGKVIANSFLFQPGTYNDVAITVEDLQEGDTALFAMLHNDDGDNIFEFPGDDLPTKVNDAIVLKPLTVTK